MWWLKIRDYITIPIGGLKELIVTTDCSGSIGENVYDDIKVSYDITSYFSARVGLMELLCAKAEPIAYTVSNLTGCDYHSIHTGVNKALNDLGINQLNSISSSETNFKMVQSGFGITFIGVRDKQTTAPIEDCKYAVVGFPLVGKEVSMFPNKILSLQTFNDLLKDSRIINVLPIGSKGIKVEVADNFNVDVFSDNIELRKSSGPSTCVVIKYPILYRDELLKHYQNLFNDLFLEWFIVYGGVYR